MGASQAHIISVCGDAWLQVRTASCAATACVNSFGDEQLAVDMLADKLLFEALKFSVSGRTRACAHLPSNQTVCGVRRTHKSCTARPELVRKTQDGCAVASTGHRS